MNKQQLHKLPIYSMGHLSAALISQQSRLQLLWLNELNSGGFEERFLYLDNFTAKM